MVNRKYGWLNRIIVKGKIENTMIQHDIDIRKSASKSNSNIGSNVIVKYNQRIIEIHAGDK